MPTKHMFYAALNYAGTPNALNGCHNDQAFWTTVAKKHYGFDESNIIALKEPKKIHMMEGIEAILTRAHPGDLVVIGFSGHGTIVPPGMQAWVPSDFDWDEPKTWFTYDELDHLLGSKERQNVMVVIISDSCHSEADPRMNLREFGNPHPIKDRYLKPPQRILQRIVSFPFERNVVTSNQDNLMLAGCRKEQTSADAYIDGGYCGAFTYSTGTAMKAKRDISYQEAILKSRGYLANHGYDQVPGCKGNPAYASLPFFSLPALKAIEEVQKDSENCSDNPILRLV